MGTVSAFGSECNPGRSTYGGDTGSGTVRAFGSGDGPGQWTHRGAITFRTVRAFGSEGSPAWSTYGGTPVLDSLEHSVLDLALDGGLTKGDGGPKFGPNLKLTFLEIPHPTRNDDLVLGLPVPLPAGNVGRIALSPADGRLRADDVNTDVNNTMGHQCWNTEVDVLDQYETFNGMPVYYGGDMYDSEDSDWDDLYALTRAAYVEDYDFDVLEGMDLMVYRHSRDPDSLDFQQDCQTDVAPVCQTLSYVTRDELDTFGDYSLRRPPMRTVRTWTISTNEWYRRMTRILLIHTMGPLRILIGTCRRKRILLIQTMGPLWTLIGICRMKRIVVIRMWGP